MRNVECGRVGSLIRLVVWIDYRTDMPRGASLRKKRSHSRAGLFVQPKRPREWRGASRSAVAVRLATADGKKQGFPTGTPKLGILPQCYSSFCFLSIRAPVYSKMSPAPIMTMTAGFTFWSGAFWGKLRAICFAIMAVSAFLIFFKLAT